MQLALIKQSDDGYFINLAGKQRMLSQRLLAVANLAHGHPQSDHFHKEIEDVVNEWSTAHAMLVNGNSAIGVSPVDEPLNTQLGELSELLVYSIESAKAAAKGDSEALDNLHTSTEVYLPRMHTVVNELARTAEEKVKNTRVLSASLTLFALLMLGGLLKFVMLPYHKTLISQRYKLKDQKDQLDKQLKELSVAHSGLNQFMYVASHDMKTPLRSIGSFARLIERRYGASLPEEAKEYFGYITANASAMSRVLDDLVEFNKAGSKRKLGIVDLDAVFREVRLNLTADLQASQTVLSSEPLGEVYSSHVALAQVLQNLIKNAIVYRSSDRICKISISRIDREEGTILLVKDNGVGLSNEYCDKVFEPFQRVGDLTRPGTGIGLAICKKLMHSVGGELAYDGKPGIGTTFIIGVDCNPTLFEQKQMTSQEHQVSSIL